MGQRDRPCPAEVDRPRPAEGDRPRPAEKDRPRPAEGDRPRPAEEDNKPCPAEGRGQWWPDSWEVESTWHQKAGQRVWWWS